MADKNNRQDPSDKVLQKHAGREEDEQAYSSIDINDEPPKVKLPPYWKSAKDKDGDTYFYNIITRKSQWNPPEFDKTMDINRTPPRNESKEKSIRSPKEQAKEENLERQQYEIQRLQEAFIYRHMLSQFGNEEVRSDFLNGENGAIKLTCEQLSRLDHLYITIGPGLPTNQADTSRHFLKLAENFIFLVEGKNKEIGGTTYKVLKDLLLSIKECGYFSKLSQVVDQDRPSSKGVPENEAATASDQHHEILNDDYISNDDIEKPQSVEQPNEEVVDVPDPKSPKETPVINETPKYENGPLQEVLLAQGAFNFLQESQIDQNAPHMDPAVVVVHQMVSPQPTSVNFTGNAYPVSPPVEGKIPVNGTENSELPSPVSPLSQVPVLPAVIPPLTVTPVLSSVQPNSQQEFDPSHPTPTQTFTNQCFADMQNMIMPQGFVLVAMHHGPMPHMAPVAVRDLSTPVTTGATAVIVPVAPVSVTANSKDDTELNSETEEIMELRTENRATRMFSPTSAFEKERSCKKAAIKFIKAVCLKGKRKKNGEEKKLTILTNFNLNPIVDLGEKVPHTKEEIKVFLHKEMLSKQLNDQKKEKKSRNTVSNSKLSKPLEPPEKKKRMTCRGSIENLKFQEKNFEDFDHLFDDPDESLGSDNSKTSAAKHSDVSCGCTNKESTMKEKPKVTPLQTDILEMKYAKMPDEPLNSDLSSSSQNEKSEDSTQSLSSEISSDSSSDSDEEREKKWKMLQEQEEDSSFDGFNEEDIRKAEEAVLKYLKKKQDILKHFSDTDENPCSSEPSDAEKICHRPFALKKNVNENYPFHKGPRVKRVCRSKSFVLGLPRATFTDFTDKEVSKSCVTQFHEWTISSVDSVGNKKSFLI